MKYHFSEHALNVKIEREIKDEWIEQTLDNPEVQEIGDDGMVHFIKRITKFGNRFLRIVVNLQNNKIVTLFFDRRLKKKEL